MASMKFMLLLLLGHHVVALAGGVAQAEEGLTRKLLSGKGFADVAPDNNADADLQQACSGTVKAENATALFRLNNATLENHLHSVATPRREVIFASVSLPAENVMQLQMIQNFMWHLHHVGRAGNTMLISQHFATCQQLVALEIPCYVDDMSPRGKEWSDESEYREQPWFTGKSYWSLHLARLNYTSLFLDVDAVAMADPLPKLFAQAPFDIQGLSDFHGAELPRREVFLKEGCQLYRHELDATFPGGEQLVGGWHVDKNLSTRAMVPCQSTGVFYTRPSPAAIAFWEAYTHWLMHTHVRQWEQAAFNEVIMAFLFGLGDTPPLKYRILPVSSFMNIEVLVQRKAAAMPSKPAIIHAGYVHGDSKREEFEKLGLWRSGSWKPELGKPTMTLRRRSCSAFTHLANDGGGTHGVWYTWCLLAVFGSIGIAAMLILRTHYDNGYSQT